MNLVYLQEPVGLVQQSDVSAVVFGRRFIQAPRDISLQAIYFALSSLG